ncbi:TPA: hypothetical protein NJ068_002548 [Vibrio parahaemolyticus]|nr:hypothetical protein [Vibrio parahaemolyticus]
MKIKKSIIGCVLPGNTPVDLIIPISKKMTKYEFLVYSPHLYESQKKRLKKSGIKYTTEFNLMLLNLPSINLMLTFGLLPHIVHRPVIELASVYKKLGGNVIDFQHGLFQWGINFSDNFDEQGYSSGKGLSLPIKTLADMQITWFGEQKVGFPRGTPVPTTNEGYTLIATNTNWHVYSKEEQIKLAKLIYEYIKENGDTYFLWKPHPAEFNPNLSTILSVFDFSKLDNLEIISHGVEGQSLELLIAGCNNVISTVGTSLLDIQVYEKPCLVYKTKATAELVAQFDSVKTFSSSHELSSKNFGKVFYTKIKDFCPDVFESIAQEHFTNISYSELLSKVDIAKYLDVNR